MFSVGFGLIKKGEKMKTVMQRAPRVIGCLTSFLITADEVDCSVTREAGEDIFGQPI